MCCDAIAALCRCGIRTLESHVFEEVGGTVGAICLGARAGIDPNADGGGLSGRVGLGSDGKTIGEGGGLGDGLARDGSSQVTKVEGGSGGRELLGSGEPQRGLCEETSSHSDGGCATKEGDEVQGWIGR